MLRSQKLPSWSVIRGTSTSSSVNTGKNNTNYHGNIHQLNSVSAVTVAILSNLDVTVDREGIWKEVLDII